MVTVYSLGLYSFSSSAARGNQGAKDFYVHKSVLFNFVIINSLFLLPDSYKMVNPFQFHARTRSTKTAAKASGCGCMLITGGFVSASQRTSINGISLASQIFMQCIDTEGDIGPNTAATPAYVGPNE